MGRVEFTQGGGCCGLLGWVWCGVRRVGVWELREELAVGLGVGGVGEALARFVRTGALLICLMEGDSVRDSREG